MNKSELTKAWDRLKGIHANMIARCKDIKHPSYRRYGGRGISVCEEWLKFDNFFIWSLQNNYKDNLTLDRKDNDKGYSPENCRWLTVKQQNNNKSNVPLYEYNGKSQTLTSWCKDLNLDIDVVRNLLNMHNITIDKIFDTPKEWINTKTYTIFGQNKTIVQWSKFLDMPVHNLYIAMTIDKIAIPIFVENYYNILVTTGKRPKLT